MKRKRWIAYILIVSLLIGDILRWNGQNQVKAAETESAMEIRLLDGKATLKELFAAFGGGKKDYHYSLQDQIAWKRVNYDDRSSDSLAENIWNQQTYILEQDSSNWKTIGTFYFQFYHNIAVKTEGKIPTGGGITVSGESVSKKTFEVNEGDELKLEFAPVEGYEVQVKIDDEAWLTCENAFYSFVSDRSADISVRYAEIDSSKHHVNVTVIGADLGTYSGLTESRVGDGESLSLVVTPYNEKTTTDRDLDAYVKSVKLNGKEVLGSYVDTAFYADSYTVTADTKIEIEFATRFAKKTGTELQTKYEGDSPIYMYLVQYIRDDDVKTVYDQRKQLEANILEAVVDKEQTAGYDPSTAIVKLKAHLSYWWGKQYELDLYETFDQKLKDIEGAEYVATFKPNDYWGDWSFGNDDETWEEIRLILPATDRYPEVVTEDLTFWLEEIRSGLRVKGTTANVQVESGDDIKSAIQKAALEKVLSDNGTLNEEQKKAIADKISYKFTTPKYKDLKTNQATNVSVKVTIKATEYYLKSSGTITVPVKKTDVVAQVEVESDENGVVTYRTNEDKSEYQFKLTPVDGYYVNALQIKSKTEGESETTQTYSVEDMESSGEEDYSYHYVMTAELNYEYDLYATFTKYTMTASADNAKISYYDGLYSEQTKLEEAIAEQVTLTPKADDKPLESIEEFPEGTLFVEYLAREESNQLDECWMTVGSKVAGEEDESSEYYNCHSFGACKEEKIRYRYVMQEDQYEITSDTVILEVEDARIPTKIKWKTEDVLELDYEEYRVQEDKAAYLKELLFDGIYYTAEGNTEKLIEGANVTFSPELGSLSAGRNLVITANYAGDSVYKSVTAMKKLVLVPWSSEVKVEVDKSAVPYGSDYQVTVTTTPENAEVIQLIVGYDLENFSLTEKSYGAVISVNLIAPEKVRTALVESLKPEKEDKLTINDIAKAVQSLQKNTEKVEELGLSADAMESLVNNVEILKDMSAGMPATLGGEQPKDIGFYMIMAILAEENYDAAMGIGYLAITPKHHVVELGWKNKISGSVNADDLETEGYFDAVATKVSDGVEKETVEQNLTTLFIGVNAKGEVAMALSPEDLTPGVYTQVAVTTDWGNSRYSCLPIIREFSVEGEYVDVQFVDEENHPVTTMFTKVEDVKTSDVQVTDSKGNLLDKEDLEKNLTVHYSSLSDLSPIVSDDVEEDDKIPPTESGLYLVNAIYRRENADESMVFGKASAIMVITDTMDGFCVKDKTVTYDGEQHFVEVTDKNESATSYITVIIKRGEKYINIILPEEYDEVSDFTDIPNLGELLEKLGTLSGNEEDNFVKSIIEQIQGDLLATTGYTVEIGGKRPIDAGEYQIYLMTIPTELFSEETESTGETEDKDDIEIKLALEKAELRIEKCAITDVREVLSQITTPKAEGDATDKKLQGTHYSAQISWDCEEETFGYGTAYTATIQFTSDPNYRFEVESVDGWTFTEEDGILFATKTFVATDEKEPEEPNKPVTPEEPEEPNKPVTPEEPEEPNKPVTPEEPEEPNKPMTPEEPETPSESVTPEESNKSDELEKEEGIELPQQGAADTSDPSHIWMWVLYLFGSLVTMGSILKRRRKVYKN